MESHVTEVSKTVTVIVSRLANTTRLGPVLEHVSRVTGSMVVTHRELTLVRMIEQVTLFGFSDNISHTDALKTRVTTFASFSADGTRIVTASYDKTAKVWEAK